MSAVLHILHDNVIVRLFYAGIEYRQDIRMFEHAGDPDFIEKHLLEFLEVLFVSNAGDGSDLDGYLAIVIFIEPEIDNAHTAPADFPEEPILADMLYRELSPGPSSAVDALILDQIKLHLETRDFDNIPVLQVVPLADLGAVHLGELVFCCRAYEVPFFAAVDKRNDPSGKESAETDTGGGVFSDCGYRSRSSYSRFSEDPSITTNRLRYRCDRQPADDTSPEVCSKAAAAHGDRGLTVSSIAFYPLRLWLRLRFGSFQFRRNKLDRMFSDENDIAMPKIFARYRSPFTYEPLRLPISSRT